MTQDVRIQKSTSYQRVSGHIVGERERPNLSCWVCKPSDPHLKEIIDREVLVTCISIVVLCLYVRQPVVVCCAGS